MSEARFLGIDFSGGAGPWKTACASPTVWIATLDGFRLADLRPVQELSGDAPPFARLTALLREGRFRAAAIDAPFSLPEAHIPAGGHAQLLADVAALAPADDRPFPLGSDLLELAERQGKLKQLKPTRGTERAWRERNVNVRSTLWNGPRGGAPFTAGCLTLLANAKRPVWPWRDGPGMLVEAFPAAQLKAWDLPHTKYGPPLSKEATQAERTERRAKRKKILAGVIDRTGFDVARKHADAMVECTDALDAFIAAFAGRAAANRQLKLEKPANWKLEGAIAVHA